MEKISLPFLIKAYYENKKDVDNYFAYRIIEGYNDFDDNIDNDFGEKRIAGMTVGVFSVFFLINLAIFILAIVFTIKNWNQMPTSYQILCIIFLFFLPIVSLILALVIKK